MASTKYMDAVYDFGVCPACGRTLSAGVIIDPQIGLPKFEGSVDKVTVSVQPKVTGFAVTHVCGGAMLPVADGAGAA